MRLIIDADKAFYKNETFHGKKQSNKNRRKCNI